MEDFLDNGRVNFTRGMKTTQKMQVQEENMRGLAVPKIGAGEAKVDSRGRIRQQGGIKGLGKEP